jgi:hypothetical protein
MPADNESEEISHLIRDKNFPKDRAVAAAMNMKRKGQFKGGRKLSSRPRKRR